MATQTDLPRKYAEVQVSHCRECHRLALVSEGRRNNTCVRNEQVSDLFSLVVQLKEEVGRLNSNQAV